MEEFEALLAESRGAVERFVRFRIGAPADAEDVLQEIFLTAFTRFGQLRSRESFRAWLISIARNKCADYYRQRRDETSLEALDESELVHSRFGLTEPSCVRETLDALGGNDRQILLLYYFEELKQTEIAKALALPLGTVKSRLNTARRNFKNAYPYPPKGEKKMKKMPEIMPEYRIIPNDQAPFAVQWEELMGWFIVPKQGEKLCWAMYDFPGRKRGEYVELEADGRAEIHGVEGVIVRSKEYDAMPCNRIDETGYAERSFVAQLTDSHCRFLAESHVENGVRKMHTFLDGDEFLPNWGFGEDNCGSETHITARGDIVREGSDITAKDKPFLLDVVGRYTVEIGGRSYDTICVMDIETYIEGAMSEQFIDRNGRTVLWRRFNSDGWRTGSGGKPWTELLPGNETLRVNGKTYVHWYDCITDYVI